MTFDMPESRASLLLSLKKCLSKTKAKTIFTYDVCLIRGRKSLETCFQPEYKIKLFATKEVVILLKSVIYFSMLAKKAPFAPASLDALLPLFSAWCRTLLWLAVNSCAVSQSSYCVSWQVAKVAFSDIEALHHFQNSTESTRIKAVTEV